MFTVPCELNFCVLFKFNLTVKMTKQNTITTKRTLLPSHHVHAHRSLRNATLLDVCGIVPYFTLNFKIL